MQKAIKVLSFVGKLAGIIAGLSSYAGMIPEKYAPLGIIIFGCASILKDAVNRAADLLDDGQINNSIGR